MNTMVKSYCFKLYNSKKNKYLKKLINISAQIYNHCIALYKRYYRIYGKHLNKYRLQTHITKLKKLPKYTQWNELGSQAIQDITDRIERAYTLFFGNLKRKIRCAPPSFKKSRKYKSFTLKQAGYKFLDGNKIKIGGKIYKFFKSREIDGIIKTLTIKRDTLGDIYIYIVCETNQAKPIVSRTGKSVGYDFGLKTFLKASDGNDIESPEFFKKSQSKIKKLNRELSRKQKGFNHRKQAKYNLAKQHIKITNQRKDFQFKLANQLCKTYDIICLEDLNIKAMQRMWGKKISDLSHSSFVNILKSKAIEYDVKIVEIPRFYPSSKTCSNCGCVLDELPLKVRSWTCPTCGRTHDRDLNAAFNILRVGTSTLGRDTVSPALVGSYC
jgi:putative transposase